MALGKSTCSCMWCTPRRPRCRTKQREYDSNSIANSNSRNFRISNDRHRCAGVCVWVCVSLSLCMYVCESAMAWNELRDVCVCECDWESVCVHVCMCVRVCVCVCVCVCVYMYIHIAINQGLWIKIPVSADSWWIPIVSWLPYMEVISTIRKIPRQLWMTNSIQ